MAIDLQPGDIVRFRRHSTAGGPDFGKYREKVTIVRKFQTMPLMDHMWKIKRGDGGVYNAYGVDLALVKAAEIPGDNDDDCI